MLQTQDLDIKINKIKKNLMSKNHMEVNNPYQNHQDLGAITESRRTKFVKKKWTEVKMPRLCKEECSECGGINIFFSGVTKYIVPQLPKKDC